MAGHPGTLRQGGGAPRRGARAPGASPIGDATAGGDGRDAWAVGMNPFRQHRRSPADYVMVAAALLVLAALVAWAFFG